VFAACLVELIAFFCEGIIVFSCLTWLVGYQERHLPQKDPVPCIDKGSILEHAGQEN